MPESPPRPLRVSAAVVNQYLDSLDQEARRAPLRDLRAYPRFSYRPGPLPAEIAVGEGAPPRHLVAPRNLSAGGMGMLAGQFLYSGTPCRITLQSLHGREEHVGGHVVRCRYVVGSGSLYDVGVCFQRAIDVPLYARGAGQVRVLLVDESPRTHDLIGYFVRPLNVELTSVTSAVDAAAAALHEEFALILLDLESATFDAFLVTRELRKAGYLGPIVGLAVQSGAPLRRKCQEAGCTGYLTKPITRAAIAQVIESLRGEPLLSTLAADEAMAPLINDFVGRLPGLARQMSAAFENGDYEIVRDIARQLRADAGSYGFEPITNEAGHVQTLAAMEAPPARLRPALYELIHLCLAARPAATD